MPTLVWDGDCYACSKNKLLDWFHSQEPFPNALWKFQTTLYIEGLRAHLTHQHFFWWSIQYLTIKWSESTNKQPMDRWVDRWVEWPSRRQAYDRWRVSPLFWWTLWLEHAKLLLSVIKLHLWNGPRLDHIFIWLGPAPPTPPLLPSLATCTCMGVLPPWEPMW